MGFLGSGLNSFCERDFFMSENKNEKIEEAEARGRIYFFLSRVFLKEVSPDFLKSLKDDNFIASLKEMGVDLNGCLFNDKEDVVIERLAEEYSQLFIVPGGLSLCESVWEKGLLLQEPASKVRAFYKRCGFELPEDFNGFPDHMGVELSFMGHLADSEAKSWKDGKDKIAKVYGELQVEFLKKHLNKWALKCCEEVKRCTFSDFYRDIAQLTQDFLQSEVEEFIPR